MKRSMMKKIILTVIFLIYICIELFFNPLWNNLLLFPFFIILYFMPDNDLKK